MRGTKKATNERTVCTRFRRLAVCNKADAPILLARSESGEWCLAANTPKNLFVFSGTPKGGRGRNGFVTPIPSERKHGYTKRTRRMWQRRTLNERGSRRVLIRT